MYLHITESRHIGIGNGRLDIAIGGITHDGGSHRSTQAEAGGNGQRFGAQIGIFIGLHQDVTGRGDREIAREICVDRVAHEVGDVNSTTAKADQAGGNGGRFCGCNDSGVGHVCQNGQLAIGHNRVRPASATNKCVNVVGDRVVNQGNRDRGRPQASCHSDSHRLGVIDPGA